MHYWVASSAGSIRSYHRSLWNIESLWRYIVNGKPVLIWINICGYYNIQFELVWSDMTVVNKVLSMFLNCHSISISTPNNLLSLCRAIYRPMTRMCHLSVNTEFRWCRATCRPVEEQWASLMSRHLSTCRGTMGFVDVTPPVDLSRNNGLRWCHATCRPVEEQWASLMSRHLSTCRLTMSFVDVTPPVDHHWLALRISWYPATCRPTVTMSECEQTNFSRRTVAKRKITNICKRFEQIKHVNGAN